MISAIERTGRGRGYGRRGTARLRTAASAGRRLAADASEAVQLMRYYRLCRRIMHRRSGLDMLMATQQVFVRPTCGPPMMAELIFAIRVDVMLSAATGHASIRLFRGGH